MRPKTKRKQYLDYHECISYLEKKYNFKARDYAGKDKWREEQWKILDKKYGPKWRNVRPDKATGKEKQGLDEWHKLEKHSPPYLDFWNWVVDHKEVSNPCYISFSEWDITDKQEEWVNTIIRYIIKEFGEVEMEVSW